MRNFSSQSAVISSARLNLCASVYTRESVSGTQQSAPALAGYVLILETESHTQPIASRNGPVHLSTALRFLEPRWGGAP